MPYEALVKLLFSMLLGLLIGIDRELKHKPIGIKTCMVISIASCLITIVSIDSVGRFAVPGHTNMDPMRLAAQIVSGVGFLGAGVILRRSNEIISGLTTAAMVWAASALGIAAGTGFYGEALTAVLFIMLAVNLLPAGIRFLGPSRLSERDMSVSVVVRDNDRLYKLMEEIKRAGLSIKHMKIKDEKADRQQIHMIVYAPEGNSTSSIYQQIKQISNVVSVGVESIRH